MRLKCDEIGNSCYSTKFDNSHLSLLGSCTKLSKKSLFTYYGHIDKIFYSFENLLPSSAEEFYHIVHLASNDYLNMFSYEELPARFILSSKDKKLLKFKNIDTPLLLAEHIRINGYIEYLNLVNISIIGSKNKVIYDFECNIDGYLFDNGFSIIVSDKIEYVPTDVSIDLRSQTGS